MQLYNTWGDGLQSSNNYKNPLEICGHISDRSPQMPPLTLLFINDWSKINRWLEWTYKHHPAHNLFKIRSCLPSLGRYYCDVIILPVATSSFVCNFPYNDIRFLANSQCHNSDSTRKGKQLCIWKNGLHVCVVQQCCEGIIMLLLRKCIFSGQLIVSFKFI